LFESAQIIAELRRLADCSSVLNSIERLRELIKAYIHAGEEGRRVEQRKDHTSA
jgi:hypothetical protein